MDVNEYPREINGEGTTARDLQTRAGTFLAVLVLRDVTQTAGDVRKSTLVRAVEQVSRHLGNTAAVCRKRYIHPAIFDGYLDGTLANVLERRVSGYQSGSIEGMSAQEAAATGVLRLRLPERRAACGEVEGLMAHLTRRSGISRFCRIVSVEAIVQRIAPNTDSKERHGLRPPGGARANRSGSPKYPPGSAQPPRRVDTLLGKSKIARMPESVSGVSRR